MQTHILDREGQDEISRCRRRPTYKLNRKGQDKVSRWRRGLEEGQTDILYKRAKTRSADKEGG